MAEREMASDRSPSLLSAAAAAAAEGSAQCPDLSQLMDFIPSPSAVSSRSGSGSMGASRGDGEAPGGPERPMDYEQSVDLAELTRIQLEEDIKAYRYDIDLCKGMMHAADLTPKETRKFHCRLMDAAHSIRERQHRLQMIGATQQQQQQQRRREMGSQRPQQQQQQQPVRFTPAIKRQRTGKAKCDDDVDGDEKENEDDELPAALAPIQQDEERTVKRLGNWHCRFCTSAKYLNVAHGSRNPGTASKGALKDISKMVTHHLGMHPEQESVDRCRELGQALSLNYGPFKYWVTVSHKQDVGDGSIIHHAIETLLEGNVPSVLLPNSSARDFTAKFPERASRLQSGQN